MTHSAFVVPDCGFRRTFAHAVGAWFGLGVVPLEVVLLGQASTVPAAVTRAALAGAAAVEERCGGATV